MAARFLHLADLHLGSRHDYLGEGSQERARQVKETFRSAINFALDPERGIDGLLIAGNLFDRHCPDSETLSFVRGLLGRVVAARKPVILIPGYRDGYGYGDSVYRTERWPGVDVITSAHPGEPVHHVIRDQDVYFYGVASQPGISASEFPGFVRFQPPLPTADEIVDEIVNEDAADQEISLEGEFSDGEFAEEQLGDDQLSDDQLSDDQLSDDQLSDDQLSDDQLSDEQVSDEQPADDQLAEDSFAHEPVHEDVAPQRPAIHIGLLCAGMPDHPEFEARALIQLVEPTVLSESGLDYYALGGYHGQASVQLDGTTAAYPGTPVGRRFQVGDLGPRELLQVDVEPGRAELTSFPVEGPTLEEWRLDLAEENITTPDDLVAALLARASQDIIARVHLEGPAEFICDFQEVSNKVADRFLHLELIDETDLVGSGLIRRVEGEHTIRGFFVRRMLGRIQELEARAETAGEDAPVHRELATSRAALKLGLEQFIEEEPAADVLYEAPAQPMRPRERVRPHEAAPRFDEMADEAVAQGVHPATNNGSGVTPTSRTKALLRADRGESQTLSEGEAGI